MASATATLLLPAGERFGGQRLAPATGRWLGRADAAVCAGAVAALFQIEPAGWPVAAATRQRDAGDAGQALWLRADPAHIRPDINGAKLLAHGPALGLSLADAQALLAALQPVFAGTGHVLEAPVPGRWYLRLAADTPPPEFPPLDEVLGADVSGYLPEGDAGRPWRTLLSEAQIVLHNHPLNRERSRTGLATVNSLWFWGAGRLPQRVRSSHRRVYSGDDVLLGFGALAGADVAALPGCWPDGEGGGVFDLRDARDLARLDRDWLTPALGALEAGCVPRLVLDFADGRRLTVARRHRWRFWRRPLPNLLPADTVPAAIDPAAG